MQALVISNDDVQAGKIRDIISGSGLGYHAIDIVSPCPAGVAHGQYEVAIVHISANYPEEGLEAVKSLGGNGDSMLVAVGPTNDAKLVLQAFRQGVHEYLDQGDLETELRSSLLRLRSRQLAKVKHGRIIGLLATCGGCGASTLAANLAILLAQGRGQSVLIEMRTAAADQAVILDLKPPHTLGDLCRNLDRLDENMLQQSLVTHHSGMTLLAASNGSDEITQVTPEGVSSVLGLAQRLFPYVLLDLDRALRGEHIAAISQSDLLLLVLRLDMLSLGNAKNIVHHLKGLGIAGNRIRGIANRCGQSKELPVRKMEQALGIPISYQIPDDPARMNLATNEGIPVVLQHPWAKVSRSLAKLATDLRERQELYRYNANGASAREAEVASMTKFFAGSR